jgi:hypothetical protein
MANVNMTNFLTRIPGAQQAPQSQTSEKEHRQKSLIWLNTGYYENETDEQGNVQTRFVRIAGIGLDTIERKSVSGDGWLAKLRFAEYDSLDQVLEYAWTFEPGEERVLCGDPNVMCTVLKRVGEAKAQTGENNPFVRKLKFVA